MKSGNGVTPLRLWLLAPHPGSPSPISAPPSVPRPDCALAPWAHSSAVPSLSSGAVLRVAPGQVLAVRGAVLGGCAATAIEGPLAVVCMWDIMPANALPAPAATLPKLASWGLSVVFWTN